ncbi:hypothetical protein ZHAS_00006284 [Anopheles sinensis]|uniref:Uncharacterized protein n=1 Tax=Anopheles sinensis TaxID=74873 RepID=A0A084VLF7_ANOSI|nr:hypothetical protein ZHAS_00006284 [Anopheles sinensis]
MEPACPRSPFKGLRCPISSPTLLSLVAASSARFVPDPGVHGDRSERLPSGRDKGYYASLGVALALGCNGRATKREENRRLRSIPVLGRGVMSQAIRFNLTTF